VAWCRHADHVRPSGMFGRADHTRYGAHVTATPRRSRLTRWVTKAER
jgi:hypothetical protein